MNKKILPLSIILLVVVFFNSGANRLVYGAGKREANLRQNSSQGQMIFKKIISHWQSYLKNKTNFNQVAAQSDLIQISSLHNQMTVKNMFSLSAAILREAKNTLQWHDFVRAQNLTNLAIKISPAYLDAYLFAAKIIIKSDNMNLGKAFNYVRKGIIAGWKDFRLKGRIKAILTIFLFLSVSISFSIFALIILVKYFKFVAHTLYHLTLTKINSFFCSLALFLFLGMLVFFKFGPLIILGIFSTMTLLYQNRREKVISYLFLLFIGFSNPLYSHVTDALLFPLPQANILYELNYNWTPESRTKESQKSLLKPTNKEIRDLLSFSTALRAKRNGDLKKAFNILQLLKENKRLKGKVMNNLGNIYFTWGNFQTASEHYLIATNNLPGKAEIHYNLGQTYFQLENQQMGEEEIKKAFAISSLPVFSPLHQKVIEPAQRLLDIPLEHNELKQVTWINVKERIKIRNWLWQFSGGKFPLYLTGFFSQLLVIITLLTFILIRQLQPSSRCSYCGSIICKKCQTESEDETICLQCHRLVNASVLINLRTRMKQGKKIDLHTFVTKITTVIFTLLAQGAGHIWLGASLAGFLILSLFSLAISSLLLSNFPAVYLLPTSDLFMTTAKMFLIFFWGIIFLFSFISIISMLRKS